MLDFSGSFTGVSSGFSSTGSSTTFASLVMYIVYVFVVPSSAVHTTLTVFLPSFKLTSPVPDIVCESSAFSAYTFTFDTSYGTEMLYVVVSDLKLLKSFGFIPNIFKLLLLDFCGSITFIFIVLDTLLDVSSKSTACPDNVIVYSPAFFAEKVAVVIVSLQLLPSLDAPANAILLAIVKSPALDVKSKFQAAASSAFIVIVAVWSISISLLFVVIAVLAPYTT